MSQIVLLKDQKKCFSIDNPGYEPEVVAVHPGGDTVAVGGTVKPFFLYSVTLVSDLGFRQGQGIQYLPESQRSRV